MQAALEDRLAVASALILQAPPGEVNDVFNDIRPIVADDSALERGLLPALAQYNTEQLTLVELPNAARPAMICDAARVPGDPARFVDPHSQQTFVFDHLRLAPADFAPCATPDTRLEARRTALQTAADAYVQAHFQNAVCCVFVVPPTRPVAPGGETASAEETDGMQGGAEVPDAEDIDLPDTTQHTPAEPVDPTASDCPPGSQKFKLYIVGNKYNPTNYWTGRWRSIYEIDGGTGTVTGTIAVNVHYYEQGNVQLATTHEPQIVLPASDADDDGPGPEKTIAAIANAENSYQASLNAAYAELGDHTFKMLRRALPVTKQKVNWNNLKTRIVLDDH